MLRIYINLIKKILIKIENTIDKFSAIEYNVLVKRHNLYS